MFDTIRVIYDQASSRERRESNLARFLVIGRISLRLLIGCELDIMIGMRLNGL
jgi:hypothetical protein